MLQRFVLDLWISVTVVCGLGCSGSVPHPPYSPHATSALISIDVPPPPGRIEEVPPRPPGADAWVDGEWILRHGRWYWLLGRWVRTPPGATYAPWVLVRASDGTPYYAPSAWLNAKGEPIAAPEPISFATASGETVFSPEGDAEDTGRSLKTAPARAPARKP